MSKSYLLSVRVLPVFILGALLANQSFAQNSQRDSTSSQAILLSSRQELPSNWKSLLTSANPARPVEMLEQAQKASLHLVIENNVVFLFDRESLSFSAREEFNAALIGISTALSNGTDLKSVPLSKLPADLSEAVRNRLKFHFGGAYEGLKSADFIVQLSPGYYWKLRNGDQEVVLSEYLSTTDPAPTDIVRRSVPDFTIPTDQGALTRVLAKDGVAAYIQKPRLDKNVYRDISRAYEIAAELAEQGAKRSFEIIDGFWNSLVKQNVLSGFLESSVSQWSDLPPAIQARLERSVRVNKTKHGFRDDEAVESFFDGVSIVQKLRILGVSGQFRDTNTGQIQSFRIRVWLDGN